MGSNYIIVLALGIGVVAGLRAMTAPAVLSWAAHLGCLNLRGTPLAFMGSVVAVAIFSLAALGEYVNDILPKTPSRTAIGPLTARVLMGALCGAALCMAAGTFWITGAIAGAIGAVLGAFGGYQVRMRLVKALNVKDIFVAIPEDLVAIALAYFFTRLR